MKTYVLLICLLSKAAQLKIYKAVFLKVFFGSGIWLFALKNMYHKHFEIKFLERDELRTDDPIQFLILHIQSLHD